ncbi:MAG: metal ABC transporter substrate-binding protein [Phycisphaerae bacterium]
MEPASTARWRVILLVAVIMTIVAAVVFLPSGRDSQQAARFRVLCTFLPNYVFALNVVGDTPGVDVRLLVSTDVGCPHNYVVTPADLKAVSQADMIVANGLGLESFLDTLRKANPKARLVTISDDCEILQSRTSHHHKHHTTEAAASTPAIDHQATPNRHEHEYDNHHQGAGTAPAQEAGKHDDEKHAGGEPNPHVWVSPIQAVRQIRNLARRLSEADPEYAARYQANAEAYVARVEALHQRMREASVRFTNRRIVTFHDAFAYLAKDLDLEVVATLTLDPSRPPSAAEMTDVINTIRRTGAAAVFFEPAYSDAVARTISRDAGVPAFPLNPFNSLDVDPTERSYERVMEANLEVLIKALGS